MTSTITKLQLQTILPLLKKSKEKEDMERLPSRITRTEMPVVTENI